MFERWARAIADRDFATLESMVHPDMVTDYPQSGERFRGFAAMRAQLERYPGGRPPSSAMPRAAKIIGGEERWAITPGYTVLPLTGPERYTTIARARYPDESLWWVVSIVELKDGKVYRSETYFAPDFAAPEWRRDIAESIPRED
jgi:hypothetical protein